MKTALLLILASICYGQTDEKTPQAGPKFYRFDFAVKEIDGGKNVSVRNYSAIANLSVKIRSGDKIAVSAYSGGKQEVTYLDVGTNIDCKIFGERGAEVMMSVATEISTSNGANLPVISQTKWESTVMVPLKKPTVIYSSESTTKKVTTQLEVTATPLQ